MLCLSVLPEGFKLGLTSLVLTSLRLPKGHRKYGVEWGPNQSPVLINERIHKHKTLST